MKKKVVAVCATVALAAVALGGATLAYFTDKDQVDNTFAIGDLSIDLWEYTGEMTDGDDGEKVPVKNQEGFAYKNLMPTDELTKEPVVENTGDNPAYVRVVVEVENNGKLTQLMSDNIDDYHEGELNYDEEQMKALYNTIFNGWGIHYEKKQTNSMRFWMEQRSDSKVLAIDSIRNIGGGNYWMFDESNTFMSANEKMWKEEVRSDCYGYYGDDDSCSSYYAGLMEKGDGKLIYVFYLELEPTESYTLFKGLNVPESFDEESMAFFDDLEINIYADAIQTKGFDGDWKAAFNALEEAHPMSKLA